MCKFHYSQQPVLEPVPGCPWAETMVLNPAFIKDPKGDRLHMIFRASGPWKEGRNGQPLPYPIFLGYAYSDNGGNDWVADFSRPALAPALEYDKDKLYCRAADGRLVLNHANGCIEDPRLFYLEGQLYLTCACRMFPPGPYWEVEGVALTQCAPEWALGDDHDFGAAATVNVTVSVLYKVDLEALKAGRYEQAFEYVTHLTEPDKSDNRDVMLFPERIMIDGRLQYLCLHRPWTPQRYAAGAHAKAPGIFLAAADSLEKLATPAAQHHLLAEPEFEWESDRIGASWPPVRIGPGEWLLPYHGKHHQIGYTQSFMILQERQDGWPVIQHRCSTRLMYASQPWELKGKFALPCLFTCAGQVIDGKLIMSYGAADTRVGMSWVDFESLLAYLHCFDSAGRERQPQPLAALQASTLPSYGDSSGHEIG